MLDRSDKKLIETKKFKLMDYSNIYNKSSLLVILLSLILSMFVSKYNLNKYDKNILDQNIQYHQMLKTNSFRYFSHGNEIKMIFKMESLFFHLEEKIIQNIYHQELQQFIYY